MSQARRQFGEVKINNFMRLKKLLAILLFLQIGSNNTFAGELARVPALLRHFHHHSREHHDVANFADFLHKHYSKHHAAENDHGHDGEGNEHDLPFNHCDNPFLNIANPFVGSRPIAEVQNQCQALALHYTMEDDNVFCLHVCNIWQPPKIG